MKVFWFFLFSPWVLTSTMQVGNLHLEFVFLELFILSQFLIYFFFVLWSLYILMNFLICNIFPVVLHHANLIWLLVLMWTSSKYVTFILSFFSKVYSDHLFYLHFFHVVSHHDVLICLLVLMWICCRYVTFIFNFSTVYSNLVSGLKFFLCGFASWFVYCVTCIMQIFF